MHNTVPISVSAFYYGETRQLTVITCRKARKLGIKVDRDYGYTIQIEPPIRTESEGSDIEGLGWVPHPKRVTTSPNHGWYKFKADAVKSIQGLAKAAEPVAA